MIRTVCMSVYWLLCRMDLPAPGDTSLGQNLGGVVRELYPVSADCVTFDPMCQATYPSLLTGE